MTIPVTCPCGGRFAAQPHLAGKTVRCPNCQQSLRIPTPAREPLAPIVNPFSDSAPIEAELVPPASPQVPQFPSSQDPFGGKATVGPSAPQAAAAPYVAATYAQPQTKGHTNSSHYDQQFANQGHGGQAFEAPRNRSYTVYYIFGAVLFGMVGFVFVAGVGVYQFTKELSQLDFGDFSSPLPIQNEDYAQGRAGFKTSLTRRAGAPQEWEPLETPGGAVPLYYRSGGHALTAYVDPPPADGQRRPGVVFLHGGFAWGDGDWEMPQPYRDQGFVVMCPVLRGENGQPGLFSLYYDEVGDVLAATSAFAALPYVDETQLYICGHSAGGTLATLTALTTDRFLALASFSGTMNQDGIGDWDPNLVVYDETNEREILMRSPEAFAKSFKCPAQLYYGSEEEWFSEETKRTAATARSAGLNVQAMVVPGDHMSAVAPAMLRSVTFFRQIGLTRGKLPQTAFTPPSLPQEFTPPGFTPPDLSTNAPPDVGELPDVTATEVPTIPGRVMPEIPSPEIPRPPFAPPGRPSFPTPPPRPTLPTGPPGMHQGVVTFEIVDYSGRMPQRISAQRALMRNVWADTSRMRIDEEARMITVPARRRLQVDTAKAKELLEAQGFRIGATTFTPNEIGERVPD